MSKFQRSKFDGLGPAVPRKPKVLSTHDILLDIISDNMFMPEKDIYLTSRLIEDLGMEELDIVEVVIDIEQRFNIEIDNDDIDNLLTFGGLHDYVSKKIVKEVTDDQRIVQSTF